MELLTWMELAERFPVDGVKNSEDSWGYLLKRLRDTGKLIERRGPDCKRWHYRFMPSARQPVRKYRLEAVVVCICREAQSLTPKPLTSYLCDTYYSEFCEIIKAASISEV